MNEKGEIDINIIKALYYGNHLEDHELERAHKLMHLLSVELRQRITDLNHKQINED